MSEQRQTPQEIAHVIITLVSSNHLGWDRQMMFIEQAITAERARVEQLEKSLSDYFAVAACGHAHAVPYHDGMCVWCKVEDLEAKLEQQAEVRFGSWLCHQCRCAAPSGKDCYSCLEAELVKVKSANAMLESAVNGANQMMQG